jgi:NADH-quinone oxidoreductase subunit L
MDIHLHRWLLWIPLLPLIGATVHGLCGRWLPRWVVRWVACGTVGAAAVISALCLHAILNLPPNAKISASFFDWLSVGDLAVPFRLTVDRLSAVMINVVTWVGLLIHVYSVGYMAHDRGYARYFAYLNLFAFSMLVLVLADNLVLMFVGWEGVGLCSYLLIGFWYEDSEKATFGRKAFVVNRVGDFGFLLGIFLLFFALRSSGAAPPGGARSLSFDSLAQNAGRLSVDAVVTPACLLLFLGAMGKSAQIPLYVWLPDAMAGPTPVSALIHAATMVTAGIYMVARLHFLYALSPFAQAWVAAFGAATAFWAASIAIAQRDIKKILAYSTVSQLGYMFVGVGLGAAAAGIFHLVTHAFFKAALFLGAGSVMHALAGETDIWKMGGLWKRMRVTSAVMLAATLAIMGMIPFAGFFSKDAILLHAFYNQAVPGDKVYWAILLVTAGITSFYMWRLFFVVFTGECRAPEKVREHIHESPPSMAVPLALLGVLSLAGGWIGWPHGLGGADRFHAYLSAMIPGPHLVLTQTQELIPMAFALGAALIGFALAWFLYYAGRSRVPEQLATGPLRPVHEAAARGWFVDDLYEVLVVRPIRWTAWLLHRVVDYFFIDLLLVNGIGWLTAFVGRMLRFFQNGQVQRYAVGFMVGVAAVLYYVLR